MADLVDLIKGQLSDQLIGQLSNQIGGARREQTSVAAQGIVNTLIGALAQNAQSQTGVQNIRQAVQRDHDGSILDQLGDLFGGRTQVRPEQTRTLNGAGILKHILGNRQNGAIDMISRMSGLDQSKTGSLMTMLAPVVMGMIGRQTRQNKLDDNGLAGLLTNTVSRERANPGNPMIDVAARFLDSDGDGSAMDDIAGMGMRFLGNLLGGRR